MRSWFYERVYPKSLDKEMDQVMIFACARRNRRKKKGGPLGITYHPNLKNIRRIMN